MDLLKVAEVSAFQADHMQHGRPRMGRQQPVSNLESGLAAILDSLARSGPITLSQRQPLGHQAFVLKQLRRDQKRR